MAAKKKADDRWQLEWVDPQTLKPHPRNYRRHPDRQLDVIAERIRQYGVYYPVQVSSDGVILCKHGVTAAALVRCGLPEVPIRRHPFKHDTPEALALMVGDNESERLADDDEEMLLELLTANAQDGLLKLTGRDEAALEQLRAEVQKAEAKAPPEDPGPGEPPADPVTRLGDVWVMGAHRLVCGDSTSADDVGRAIQGRKPQMILTSPPYGVGMEYEKDLDFDGLCLLVRDVFALWCAEVVRNGFAFVNFGDRMVFPEPMGAVYHRMFAEYGWRWYAIRYWKRSTCALAIWNTTQPRPMSDMECCWTFQNGDAVYPVHDLNVSKESLWLSEGDDVSTGHPAQMHLSIADKAIVVHSAVGDLVAEPFGGAGTTLVACERRQRVCAAVELDPRYVDVAVQRWCKLTGHDAILEATGETYTALAARKQRPPAASRTKPKRRQKK